MADGLGLPPGAGHRIRGAGMTLKVGAKQSGKWSAFEAEVAPGFDVGAHRHAEAEEIFYILAGELDLLAFEPRMQDVQATGRPGGRPTARRLSAADRAA